jgi:cob(I)alamin adenosyltransferase
MRLFFLQPGYNFHMPRFYTRNGDDGSTGLLGKGRLPKQALRMEALGDLDEASAAIGLARAQSTDPQTGELLKLVQRDLYTIMTEVATPPDNAHPVRTLEPQRVEWLETQVDAIAAGVPVPAEFILPGDSLPGATMALARTIVRRAERRVAGLLDSGEVTNKVLLHYLNRLSSLCFAMELSENAKTGKPTSLAKDT